MSHRSKAPHLGSCLSAVDILVTAYFHALSIDPKRPDDPNRDRFILSKGHGAAALYATLAHRGFFPIQQLETYCADGGSLPEHP
ncbi:MAG: transketolase, partial [Planctomycetota bacterium]|nr:transketolase [Planctomycetota bacterium]